MVRHGQTAASRENRFSGSSDPPLTAVGEAMAEAFARAYASVTWDAICTSPMLRTRQTADALCRLTGVTATVEPGLREIDYGEWEGLRQDEVKERWPEAYEYWADDVASRGTPGRRNGLSRGGAGDAGRRSDQIPPRRATSARVS